MAWVRFTADFDWESPPTRRVTVAYRAGQRLCVTHTCAAAAVAAGRAVREPTPSRDARDAFEILRP